MREGSVSKVPLDPAVDGRLEFTVCGAREEKPAGSSELSDQGHVQCTLFQERDQETPWMSAF